LAFYRPGNWLPGRGAERGQDEELQAQIHEGAGE